jgi:hypothetical protein
MRNHPFSCFSLAIANKKWPNVQMERKLNSLIRRELARVLQQFDKLPQADSKIATKELMQSGLDYVKNHHTLSEKEKEDFIYETKQLREFLNYKYGKGDAHIKVMFCSGL